MNIPVIILGAGGHGRVVLDLLKSLGHEAAGFIDRNQVLWGQVIDGVPVIGGDDEILKKPPGEIRLAMGLGGVGDNRPRMSLYEMFCARGYFFPCFFHPSSIVSGTASTGGASMVMAGAVIQAGCILGKNVIINTGALVDHDCRIGDHVHVAPGAVLSGGVTVGSGAHIGTGAVVIQNIHIGEDSVVAAGAVIVRDVSRGSVVMGVPGRER